MLWRSGVELRGVVDLQRLARHLDEAATHGVGLASLHSGLCGLALGQGKAEQCSNWQAAALSSQQMLYAAEDAAATLRVFLALRDRYAPGMDAAGFGGLFLDVLKVDEHGELQREALQMAAGKLLQRKDLPLGVRNRVQKAWPKLAAERSAQRRSRKCSANTGHGTSRATHPHTATPTMVQSATSETAHTLEGAQQNSMQ